MIFSVTLPNFINILIIASGVGICALNILQVSSGSWMRKEVKRYFQIFFSLIIVYLLAHLARQMMDGIAGAGVRAAMIGVTFVEFVVTGFMAYLISMLILFVAMPKRPRAVGIVFLVLLVIHCVLLVLAQFSDLYYYFDASNSYHRAPTYLLSNLSQVLSLGLDMYLLLRYKSKFNKRLLGALWLYLAAPVAAIIVQSFLKDIQFVILATVFGAVYMFGVIMRDQVVRFEQQKAESSRIEAELNMASAVQADMLPNIFPAFPEREEFDIYASMKPAKEVGGDFYDFFLIDHDHLGIVIADVSGKGIPAALFMMVSKILVQNYATVCNSAAKVLEAVNHQICSGNREEMFVTVWLGILDLNTGKLTAANAGHEYPALYDGKGAFSLVRDKHGFVIGGMDGVKYKEYEIQMQPGSKLFLYTDGVPEATNAANELFGTKRMIEALRGAQERSAQEILEAVNRSVSAFVKDAPQFDDLTMLCLHYKGTTSQETNEDNHE